MSAIKTAISIDKSLFEQAKALAEEMKVTRSRLFVLAMEDYLRRQRNREILEQINAAQQDVPDPAEQTRLKQMQRFQRQAIQGEW
jgi:metal-responsive CopG/Arc/MetJ family transcriptional regulator